MSEWCRRWEVELRWRAGLEGPRVAVRRVESPAQLRAVVQWARKHPDVTVVRYRAVRELIGEPPTHCRYGHAYDGGSATRATLE
jgi:hypothetical protein